MNFKKFILLTFRHVNMGSYARIWASIRYLGGCTFVGYVLLKTVSPTEEVLKKVQIQVCTMLNDNRKV